MSILTDTKKLFVIDALGALLSSFLLGVVFRRFESTFGMPKDILLVLALLPILFIAYDYYAYFNVKENWRPYLKGIAFLNSIYCCITVGLVIYHYERLTFWGVGYFVAELLIIAVVITLELKASSKSAKP